MSTEVSFGGFWGYHAALQRGMVRGSIISIAGVAAAAAALVPAARAQPRGPAQPVPSHQPALTRALWTKLVQRRPTFRLQAAGCAAVRAVFYTADDWLRLATKLAANASPCAQYYISIPPLAADKTNFRPAQPAQIRALGPQFHVLAEISYNGWTNWVAQNNSTYYAAGVEARRRMAAQGFDVSSGDSWIVNELSSALRANTGTSRQKIRDLVRGLYDGDGSVPRVKGGVYVIGLSQATSDLASYKLNLQSWLADAPFWNDMTAYVADWAQEVYGDARAYAVAGSTPDTRVAYLNDYLQHPVALAGAAPGDAATGAAYLMRSYLPLGNAAWAYQSGFGYTDVPADVMKDYVTAQVAAMRSYRGGGRLGFAWSPRMPDGSSWTPEFTSQTADLLDRIAAAIHDSDGSASPCGAAWCTGTLDGSAFTDAWKSFSTWSYPSLAFNAAPVGVTTGQPAQLSVQLQQAGLAQSASAALTVTFTSSSPSAQFAPAADGPWTSSLPVAIPAGASTAGVYVRDARAGSILVTASAAGWEPATQTVAVTAAAPTPTPVPAPVSPGGGGGGGGIPPDLSVSASASAASAPQVGGELDLAVTVATKNAGGSSDVGLVIDLPAGYGVTRVYTDRGACSTGGGQVTCDAAWINSSASTHVTIFGTVTASAELRFTATATSRLEQELDPADNVATVVVPAAQPVVTSASGGVVALRLRAAPRVAGSPVAGRTLRAIPPRFIGLVSKVAYRWHLCRGTRCKTAAGTTLRLHAADAGRTVQLVVTATNGRTTAVARSARFVIRRR